MQQTSSLFYFKKLPQAPSPSATTTLTSEQPSTQKEDPLPAKRLQLAKDSDDNEQFQNEVLLIRYAHCLSDMCFLNIFSPVCGQIFHFCCCFQKGRRFKILGKVDLISFVSFCFSSDFLAQLKKSLPTSRLWKKKKSLLGVFSVLLFDEVWIGVISYHTNI